MGFLVQQAIADMEEAMVLEGLGAKIDLLPKGSTLERDVKDKDIWIWELPRYVDAVAMQIFFYLDEGMSLAYVMAMQGITTHDLSKLDQLVVEDAFEWLFVEGKFNVEK